MLLQGVRPVEITLNNYKEIFKVCTPDILDEIRLALLDNTDIMSYIGICGNDSYKLSQYRLAIREGVYYRYLIPGLTGKTINKLRVCHRNHIDLSSLDKYISHGSLKLDTIMFEMVVEALSLGADISTVDFFNVPCSICKIICEGLVREYPMWLFVSDKFSENYIRLLMRGLDLGIDITSCLTDVYSEHQLIVIFANKEYSDILKYITPKFPIESIKVIIKACEEGLDITQLVYRDSDGYPVYSEFQMLALLDALRLQKKGIVVDDVFNPKLSDKAMLSMLDSYKEGTVK